jgi:selenide,water dikinase
MRHLHKSDNPNLLVGTETGDDAGVYRLTDELAIVQTIDFFPPVVNDPYVYGQIAAANSVSDIYAMGGTPCTALNLIGYPDDKESLDWLGEICSGGEERLQASGTVLIGGHTVRDAEIKFGYAVTGTIRPQRILTNAGARPGDALVLTKPLGTGFITTANRSDNCPEDVLKSAVQSMLQLNDVAKDAMLAAGAHAATDITGFGLAGHAFGMAKGSGTTMVLELSKLPLLPGAAKLAHRPYLTRASGTNAAYVADELKIEGKPDPVLMEFFYDAQTSGGLLISVPAENAKGLVTDLHSRGISAAGIVGEVQSRGERALVVRP